MAVCCARSTRFRLHDDLSKPVATITPDFFDRLFYQYSGLTRWHITRVCRWLAGLNCINPTRLIAVITARFQAFSTHISADSALISGDTDIALVKTALLTLHLPAFCAPVCCGFCYTDKSVRRKAQRKQAHRLKHQVSLHLPT